MSKKIIYNMLGDVMSYYDGTKLLSLKDIEGNVPEIYICTSNRTAGKTTYFGRLCVNKFLSKQEKFAILYRYKYELDDCAEKFFKDLSTLFFNGAVMTSKKRANGVYHDLYIDDAHCGYAIALNSADTIKRISHLFSDVDRIIFDEFQTESNKYCPNEVNKFISVHTSIARGQGKQTRYVPVYMIGNPVSILNPYYVELNISTRLKRETKFLRGAGFVLEQGYNETAAQSQKNSAFYKAFSSNEYTAYSSECKYLNDSDAFIENVSGASRYLATLRFKNNDYAIREFPGVGVIYCDDKPDSTFKNKIAVTTDDHNVNYVMLRNNDVFISQMRYYFERGCFRFKNLKCKEAVLSALSY